MRPTERLAAEYLRSVGFGDVQYEPGGNIPPDFLADRRVAVEVRRLNQNVVDQGSAMEGLEEAFIPVWRSLYRHVPTLGSRHPGESWYVSFDMRRPLERWGVVRPLLDAALLGFMAAPYRVAREIEIGPALTIELAKASRPHESFFLLGAGSDAEAGGFVVAEIYRNLELCLAEKERKVAPYRHKYREWWLVLVDYIGQTLDQEDQRQLQSLPRLPRTFEKVILINPLSPDRGVEV
jgi:hypothetical protein